MSDRRLERRRAPAQSERRRPQSKRQQSGPRPDRVAAWAFLLGILLILLAAGTSEGETGGADTPPVIAPTPVGVPAPELGERVLSRGAVGADVRTLQQILGAKDYGPLVPHGTFDEPTEQSVRRFQRDAGLAVDGVVGPQTRPALWR